MKKKLFLISILCILTVFCTSILFACGNMGSNKTRDGSTVAVTATHSDVYKTINKLLKRIEYPVTLTTTITKGRSVFYGEYYVTESEDGIYTVDYSYERLSYFAITDNDEIVTPENYKTRYTGRIKVKDGKIIEKKGAEVDIPVEALNVGITLSESILTDVETSEGRFSADVTSLQEVAGLSVEADSASIDISYNDTKITEITLSFTTSSYHAEIKYGMS